MSKTKKQRKY